jgi:hypothetical protein
VFRVVRGRYWRYSARLCTMLNWDDNEISPTYSSANYGFRVASNSPVGLGRKAEAGEDPRRRSRRSVYATCVGIKPSRMESLSPSVKPIATFTEKSLALSGILCVGRV